MSIHDKAHRLGEQIYAEQAHLNAEMNVAVPGQQSRRDTRLEQLAIAARFNGIALGGGRHGA